MLETLKPNIPISSNPIGRELPKLRANILHAFGKEKTLNFILDLNYKGIKISPKILYRLQSAQVNNSIILNNGSEGFGDGNKMLMIMDGKFILTDSNLIYSDLTNHDSYIIKSCIENPINLEHPEQKPNYRKHIEYNGKDYIFISFKQAVNENDDDIHDQEDFGLLSYEEGIGLNFKKIYCAKYHTNRNVEIAMDNGIPTFKLSYSNSDTQSGTYNGEYTTSVEFDLQDQRTKENLSFK